MAKGDKIKGRVKEAAGDLIDDAEIRRKGRSSSARPRPAKSVAPGPRSDGRPPNAAQEVAGSLERRT